MRYRQSLCALRRSVIELKIDAASDVSTSINAAVDAITQGKRVIYDPAQPSVSIADITEHGVALSIQAWLADDDLGKCAAISCLDCKKFLTPRNVRRAQINEYCIADRTAEGEKKWA